MRTGSHILYSHGGGITFMANGKCDKIEYTLPMGDIHGTKPSSQPKHKPRMFYFELKQVVDGLVYGTNEKPVYLYPEGYGTGRRNDGNLISFGKDDYTEEYLVEMEEQFRQW